MAELGAVAWRGPSVLTGDPIAVVITGLEGGCQNAKTGPVPQAWIIRTDMRPMDAVRSGGDAAICGDCELRGHHGADRRCYVAPWLGANNVHRTLTKGGYLEATPAQLDAVLEGLVLRMGAYGDPAAAPFEVWARLLAPTRSWIGYTSQWRRCDRRFQAVCMASVKTRGQFHAARNAGWRTFRVRRHGDALIDGQEIICPASNEADHTTTCEACRLCRGTSTLAKSVAILPHGHNGVMTAFYHSRAEALR